MLSSLAGQIRNVATLYQVYDISGSAFKLGLTGFLETLPFIIFGLFAGAVADAFDRKKLLIATISLQIVPNLMLGYSHADRRDPGLAYLRARPCSARSSKYSIGRRAPR